MHPSRLTNGCVLLSLCTIVHFCCEKAWELNCEPHFCSRFIVVRGSTATHTYISQAAVQFLVFHCCFLFLPLRRVVAVLQMSHAMLVCHCELEIVQVNLSSVLECCNGLAFVCIGCSHARSLLKIWILVIPALAIYNGVLFDICLLLQGATCCCRSSHVWRHMPFLVLSNILSVPCLRETYSLFTFR